MIKCLIFGVHFYRLTLSLKIKCFRENVFDCVTYQKRWAFNKVITSSDYDHEFVGIKIGLAEAEFGLETKYVPLVSILCVFLRISQKL